MDEQQLALFLFLDRLLRHFGVETELHECVELLGANSVDDITEGLSEVNELLPDLVLEHFCVSPKHLVSVAG